MKIVSVNKKVGRNFQLSDKLEAGIVLNGSEIKSVRAKKIHIDDAYAKFLMSPKQKPELWLVNAHIAKYPRSIGQEFKPDRSRKLLIKSSEIKSLVGTLQTGKTLIPTKVYLKNNLCKVELAIARALKKYDKRELIKKRESQRRLRRLLGQKQEASQ